MEIFENNKPIISIIKGTAISFLATIIALTVFAVLLTYTELSENTVKPVIITITGISILFGSSIGTKKIRKNGLITGGIIGTLYILIIYIISSAMNANFALSLNWTNWRCVWRNYWSEHKMTFLIGDGSFCEKNRPQSEKNS